MAFAAPVWLAVYNELLGDGAPERPYGLLEAWGDADLLDSFHLSRPCIGFLLGCLQRHGRPARVPELRDPGRVEAMLLEALHYYAHGAGSPGIRDQSGIDPSDSPAVVSRVSELLAGMTERFVSFPLTRADRERLAERGRAFCGVRHVLGAVGCAHFRTRDAPDAATARVFRNTHGYPSVVCQLVCDLDGNIMDVERCWAGSTSTHEVWVSSPRRTQMEGESQGRYRLLGGTAHHLSKHLLTPLPQPQSQEEVRFNRAHARAHGVVHRTVQLLKQRFRCLRLLGPDPPENLEPQEDLVQKENLVRACCVLHNLARKFSVPPPPIGPDLTDPEHPAPSFRVPVKQVSPEALEARQEVIDGFREEDADSTMDMDQDQEA